MSKFVYGTDLALNIEKIIMTAQERLMLFAPCIQIAPRLREELRRKINMDGMQVTVVFGKADADPSKSTQKADLEFFTTFPNVVICYEEKLGAIYYANESTAVLASVNLNNYSTVDNIEAGIVLTAKGMLKQLAGTLTSTISETEKSSFETALEYFTDAVSRSRELFRKTPQYEKGFLNLNKKYSRSVVETNEIESYFASINSTKSETPVVEINSVTTYSEPSKAESKPFFTEYKTEETPKPQDPVKQPEPAAEKPAPETTKTADGFQPGFCIRTGNAIFFNPRNPLSAQAMADWTKESDLEFPENYCHFSGEPSFGQTSFNRPILQKNLRKAQGFM